MYVQIGKLNKKHNVMYVHQYWDNDKKTNIYILYINILYIKTIGKLNKKHNVMYDYVY